MGNEASFRLATAAVALANTAIALYYRLRAAATGDPISHREEGYGFAIVLRLTGVALWLSIAAYLFHPATVGWFKLPLPYAVRWLGFATALVGTLLLYWTLSNLGKNLTDTVVTRANATLVTTGPYRWVRHPFYVTTACLMVSMTLLTANWLVAAFSGLVFAMLAVRTRTEEAKLLERFGEDYRQYCLKTGRFWPHWRKRS